MHTARPKTNLVTRYYHYHNSNDYQVKDEIENHVVMINAQYIMS